MQNLNGFINIESLLKDKVTFFDKGFIKINDESYFYKMSNDDLCYRELIAHEIANFFNIPSVYYRPALIPYGCEKYIGLIAKDYRKDHLLYVYGREIIEDYNKDYIKQKWVQSTKENNFEYHNLENLWNALNYRYRFLDNCTDIVKNLLNDIVKNIFLFDIFLENNDRHFNNWEVVENLQTEEIKLNILFDNEDIFYQEFDKSNLGCSTTNKNNGDWYDVLKEFLNISDNEYLLIVQKMYERLTPKNLEMLINLTERKHKITIPFATKNDIMLKYNLHYKKIGKVINKFLRGNKKQVLI